MADMLLSNYVTKSAMENRVKDKKLSHSEISNMLRSENPGVQGLSERSVRRFCTKHSIL